jgi:hypothetical protein
MSPPALNSTRAIQVADDSTYPIREVPSLILEKPGGSSDVEQGGEPKINDEGFNFDTKKKQVRLDLAPSGYCTGQR